MKLLMTNNMLFEGIVEKVQAELELTDEEMNILKDMDPTPSKKLLKWIANQYVNRLESDMMEDEWSIEQYEAYARRFSGQMKQYILNWLEDMEKKKDHPDLEDHLRRILTKFNDYSPTWHHITKTDIEKILKQPSDIGVYPNVASFIEVGKAIKTLMSKSQIKAEADKKQIGNYLIVAPKSVKSSCYYGAGTKWCTAGHSGNMFSNYSKDAIIFYVINLTKEDGEPLQKIAALKYFKDKGIHGIRVGDYTLWNTANKRLDNLEPEDIFPKAVVQWMNDYWTNKVKLDTPLSVEKKTALILPELEAMEGAHMDYTIGKGWEFHIEDDMGGWFATFAKEMPPEGFYIVYATPFYDGVDFVPVDMQDPEGDQISYDTIKLPQVTTADEEPGKKLSQAYFERVGRMIKKMATEEGIHDHKWDKVDADTEVCEKCGLRRSLSDNPYPDSKNVMGPMTRKDFAGLGDDYLLTIAKEEGIGDWNNIENKLSPGFNRTQLLNDLADQSGDMARHQEPKDPYGNMAQWMNWYDRMGSRDMKALEKEYMKATNMSVTYGMDRDEMIQGIMQSRKHNKR